MDSKNQSIFSKPAVILPIIAVILIIAAIAVGCSGGSVDDEDEYSEEDIESMLDYAASLPYEELNAFVVGEWAKNEEDSIVLNADLTGVEKGINGSGEAFADEFTYIIAKPSENARYAIYLKYNEKDYTKPWNLGINSEDDVMLFTMTNQSDNKRTNEIYNRIG